MMRFGYRLCASMFGVICGVFFYSTSVFAAAPAVVTVVVPAPADSAVSLTWTNPADVGFTGTMVRYSASAFPTTTSDGTLASDVSGSPSGAGSLTVNGLSNGTTYYFSLFSHNAIPEYSAAVNAQQIVMPASFTEDFESLSIANANGQNGWTVVGGTWNIVDTAGEQTLKSTGDVTAYHLNRVTNGGSVAKFSNQMVRTDWKGSTAATPGQVFLRAQSASADAGGYFLWQSSGTLRANYKTSTGSTNVQLGSAAFTPVGGTWYTYEFSVVNNSSGLPVLTAYVWARGTAKPSTPTIQVTDAFPRFAQGVFSVGKTGASLAEYDNVSYFGMPGDSLANTAPADGSVTLSWTNPTYATYSGTMVRSSTSAYPASTSDGTLVANVLGSSGGTSTTTHTGLTNGTTYYYTLFPYDLSGVYGTPLYLQQVPYPVLLTEDFSTRSIADIAGQDGWTVPGGTWAVTALSSNNVLTGTSTTAYGTNKAKNGINDSTTQVVSTRFRSSAATNNAGFVWLRLQPNGKEGYLVWHNGNAWTVSYRSASALTEIGSVLAAAAPAMEADVWFNLEASIADNGSNFPVITVRVWKDGTEKPTAPTVTATDSINRATNGYIGFGKGVANETTYYDDIGFYGVAPGVSITTPFAGVAAATDVATISIIDGGDTIFVPYIQTSTTLTVTASAGTTVAVGGGVEFVLNEGLATQQSSIDLTAPYSASFSGLAKGTYTLDAYLLGADGTTHLVGATYHDERSSVGIGDIITVIGDSITEGLYGNIDGGTVTSWLDADVGTVSADNRNFPQHGSSGNTYKESFLSDLNDKLSTYYGYPVFIMNEGVSGAEAQLYSTNQIDSAWTARQNALHANKWLICLGTNDVGDGDSATTYGTNITALINTLVTTYGASASSVYLAYPAYQAAHSAQLATYNTKIDELRTSLGLAGGPDYYHQFEHYTGAEYFDGTHLNATGYIRMARIAGLSMMSPAITSTTAVSARQATMNWSSVSAAEPDVAGYRVSYGTQSDALSSTATFGVGTSGTITGLSPNTTYYFALEAFDSDAIHPAYTHIGATTSTMTAASSSSGSASVPVTYTLALTTPNGSETYAAGNTQTVVWQSSGAAMSAVNIAYSLDGGTTYVTVATNVLNTGSFEWAVPDVATDTARIRVQGGDLAVVLAQDVSDADFSIVRGSSTGDQGDGATEEHSSAGDIVVSAGTGRSPFTGEIESVDQVVVGDYIRGAGASAVYYVDVGGIRRPFMDSQTFFTYLPDFSQVRTVTGATLPQLPLGAMMLPKSGVVLVKIQSDARVYWMENDGTAVTLRWVPSEAVAVELFGNAWADIVIDLPPTMMSHFVRGADLSESISIDRSAMKTRIQLQ